MKIRLNSACVGSMLYNFEATPLAPIVLDMSWEDYQIMGSNLKWEFSDGSIFEITLDAITAVNYTVIEDDRANDQPEFM